MEHGQCHHLLGSLSDFIDGALEERLCAEIERHMQGCENCRVVVDSLRKTVTLYQETAPSSQMPDDVRQRLFHRLDLDAFIDAAGRENG